MSKQIESIFVINKKIICLRHKIDKFIIYINK